MQQGKHNEVIVVIPVYKSYLTANEKFSLNQVVNIFPASSLCFVTYKQIEDEYKPYGKTYCFSEDFFKSINGYNSLLLSREFYNAFADYKYLLIYQLDAFLFTANLSDLLSKDYDYVGAPWIAPHWKNIEELNSKLPFWARGVKPGMLKLFKNHDGMVGNGGLSLRKVSAHIAMLKKYEAAATNWNYYEDMFWSRYVPAYERNFKIPSWKQACAFFLENDPGKGMEINKGKLPLGCHAWDKPWNINFWQPYFEQYGYLKN